MRYIPENELILFLIENKNEIIDTIGLKDFDSTKHMYYDFNEIFNDARNEYMVRKTIEFLVFELNIDYDNLKQVLDYDLLRKVWDL